MAVYYGVNPVYAHVHATPMRPCAHVHVNALSMQACARACPTHVLVHAHAYANAPLMHACIHLCAHAFTQWWPVQCAGVGPRRGAVAAAGGAARVCRRECVRAAARRLFRCRAAELHV
eukprot:365576-Chlamydomonas_euryale.AAC.10